MIKIESLYVKLEKLKHYPRVFLEECRYEVNRRNMHIDESDESDNMPGESDIDDNEVTFNNESDDNFLCFNSFF